MKKFIRLSDGAVVTEQDIDPLMVYPSDNFMPSADLYEPVIETPAPATVYTESAEEGPPEQVNGQWRKTWVKRPATPAELDERTAKKTATVMADRDRLIQAFFWSELLQPSVNAGQYRQHLNDLRDVPTQPGFPWTVTWPVKP